MKRLTPEEYKLGIQRRARAEHADGKGSHGEGVIVAYIDAPSYVIVSADGRVIPWRADLTGVGEVVTDEEYFRHANARRLSDGRDSVRPELRQDGLPRVAVGMSVWEIFRRVVAHGLNPARVSIDYRGCGSHNIELDEYVRPQSEIEREFEEERRYEEGQRAARTAYDRAQAEAEEVDSDPTKGW